MKIWFDTEFIEDGRTIDLISIGMVREDGATLYRESSDVDLSRADDWVRTNVLPHLQGIGIPRAEIAKQIIKFAGDAPEFWAYYADYDWVALCQLYGRMINLPEGWPRFCRDFRQEANGWRLPKQESGEHHALSDALWLRDRHVEWEEAWSNSDQPPSWARQRGSKRA